MNEKTTIKNRIKHIGEIPTNWKIGKVKHYYKLQTGFTPDTKNDEFYDNELGETWVTIADMTSFEKYISDSSNKISRRYIDLAKPAITPKGSLLYSFKLSVGKRSFAGKELYTNEAIASFVYGSELSLDFLYYSSILIEYNAAINIYNAKLLNQELIKNAYIVFPPINEQILIAGYLDNKCSKIDSIINDLEKQIEILMKYKKSVITEAVTKGLNPDVELKDSGEAWIGDIPIHWNTTRVKFLVNINNGKEIENDEGEIPVYGSGGLFKTTDKWLFNGDSVLLGRKGTVDLPQFVTGKFWTVDTAFYTDFTLGIIAKYFYYLACCFDYDKYQSGSTIPSMTQTALGNIVIPKVSIDEQTNIVEFLDEKCLGIDLIIEGKQKQLDTIKSYKNSLIYEYVTGKKRVSQGDANE